LPARFFKQIVQKSTLVVVWFIGGKKNPNWIDILLVTKFNIICNYLLLVGHEMVGMKKKISLIAATGPEDFNNSISELRTK